MHAVGGLDQAPYIAVVGPGDATTSEAKVAEELGALLAESGCLVFCGGLGGVMEAACRGVRSRGGVSVGFLPGSDRAEGNAFLSISLPTGLGEMRNALLVRSVDAVVSVGGSWGTLSEVALSMRLGKPTFAIGGWDVSAARGEARPRRVDSPREAVSLVVREISQR